MCIRLFSDWSRYVLERQATGTQRAVGGQPQIVIVAGGGLNRHSTLREKLCARRAEHQERSRDHRRSAMRLKLLVSTPERRSCTHHVINNCQSVTANSR